MAKTLTVTRTEKAEGVLKQSSEIADFTKIKKGSCLQLYKSVHAHLDKMRGNDNWNPDGIGDTFLQRLEFVLLEAITPQAIMVTKTLPKNKSLHVAYRELGEGKTPFDALSKYSIKVETDGKYLFLNAKLYEKGVEKDALAYQLGVERISRMAVDKIIYDLLWVFE